jgi:ankyrin repeat protein
MGHTAFLSACNTGKLDCVQILVGAGCDVAVKRKDGAAGALLAAVKGHCAALQWMVDECPELSLETRDERGSTAFLSGCGRGELDCVKILKKNINTA